jgi:hypothetical protein
MIDVRLALQKGESSLFKLSYLFQQVLVDLDCMRITLKNRYIYIYIYIYAIEIHSSEKASDVRKIFETKSFKKEKENSTN